MYKVLGGFVCALTLALAACTEPGIEVRTVEVLVEKPVPCINKKDVPPEPPKVGDTLTGDAQVDLNIVSVSALSLRKTLNELYAIVEGCTIVTPSKN